VLIDQNFKLTSLSVIDCRADVTKALIKNFVYKALEFLAEDRKSDI